MAAKAAPARRIPFGFGIPAAGCAVAPAGGRRRPGPARGRPGRCGPARPGPRSYYKTRPAPNPNRPLAALAARAAGAHGRPAAQAGCACMGHAAWRITLMHARARAARVRRAALPGLAPRPGADPGLTEAMLTSPAPAPAPAPAPRGRRRGAGRSLAPYVCPRGPCGRLLFNTLVSTHHSARARALLSLARVCYVLARGRPAKLLSSLLAPHACQRPGAARGRAARPPRPRAPRAGGRRQ